MAFSSAWLHKHSLKPVPLGAWELQRGAAAVKTVANSPGSPVVSGGDHPVIPDDHSRHLTAGAIPAGGGDFGDVHKVFVPGRAFMLLTHLQ